MLSSHRRVKILTHSVLCDILHGGEMFQNRRECVEFLKDIGFLIDFNELELYHGRNRGEDEVGEWRVDLQFNNGGNATGNRNVNNRSTLYLGDMSVASEFADARALMNGGKAEVHRIVSDDKNAVFINLHFQSKKLSNDNLTKFYKALKELSQFGVTELAPVRFEQREIASTIVSELKKISSNRDFIYFHENDIRKAIANLRRDGVALDDGLVYQLAESFNARRLMMSSPTLGLSNYMKGNSSIYYNAIDKANGDDIKINLDWVASWLVNNHVIGEKVKVWSATLHKTVDTYAVFDKEKINTQKVVGDKLQSMIYEFGEITDILEGFTSNDWLFDKLSDMSPKETMKLFRTSKPLAQVMDMDAGLWEGFTVGEHTESVLRVLEDSFNGDIPEKLMPFMKVLIMSHDFGKGFEKQGRQDINTRTLLPAFHKALGITQECTNLMDFLIFDSQQYTTAYYVKKNKYAMSRLNIEAQKALSQYLGREATEGEVRGLVGIAKVLQTCDSGAYTRYGVTRDTRLGVSYNNGNNRFTESMEEPKDVRNVKQRLKDDMGIEEM